jgi:fibronectin-binding autotransporter adhesin
MKFQSNPFIRPASLLLAALTLTAIPAQAVSLFWDGTTSTANADGGNGTWDNGTTFDWDTAATGGADSVWTNANNDTAVFGGAAGTVSLGGGIQVGGLQFDTAGYLVQSNTLTFGVSGNIVTNADATLNSALAATSGLTITKTGSGILTLGGNNTYAANTTISDGILKAGSTTALSANSAFSVATSATLDLGGFNNTIKSLSTATGTITNSTGAPTLKITTPASTAQLFTGNLGLQLGGNQGIDLTNTSNTFSGGTTLGFGSGGANHRILLSGRTLGVGGPGTLTSGSFGTGPITLGAATTDRAQILFINGNTVNNAIVVNNVLGNTDAAGAFRVDAGGNVIAGAINANLAAANFRNGGGGAGGINVTGAISGTSFGLTLLAGTGVGTLNVTLASTANANTYAGDTSINSATETLTLGAADQIPNGTGKGNLIVTAGSFKMGGFSETLNGLSGTGTVDGVSGTSTLTVGDNDATGAANTFSGVIKNTAGTLAMTKTGSGTLTLSGNNTYSGATTISSGMLLAGSTSALSANSATSVAASATLDLGGFNNTIKSLATDTGTITDSSGAGLGGTLKIATVMPAGPSAQFFTGSMGLQLFGGNTVNTILSNTANNYSGGTILGNGSGSTSTRILLGAGTLGAGAPGAVTSGLFGTGPITIGAAATDKSQLYFSGAITINNAIVVNTEAGTDIIGTFRVEAGGSVLAGAINANLADARFHSFGSGSIFVPGAISGASGLKLSTTFGSLGVTLNNTGTANSYAGNTTISTANSTLTLGAANQIPNGSGKGNLIITAGIFRMGGFSETINGLSGTGTVDGISGTPTLTVGDNDATGLDNTFDGVITDTAGTLSLTKTGSGTLTLSNTNTYTGATLISGGTLLVNGNHSAATGAVTVDAVGTLGGTGTLGGAATVNGKLAPGASVGQLTFTGGLTLGSLAANSLKFELGANTTAGTTYDTVVTNALDIGTLDFADFQFTNTGALAAGAYTLTSSGAAITGSIGTASGAIGGFTGTLSISGGNTLVLTVTGSGNPYTIWAGGAGFHADANGDGVNNGLAWILGAANPGANALALLPVPGQSSGNLTMTFTQVNPMAPAKLFVEYSNDLGILDPWHSVQVPTSSGTVSDVTFTITGTTPTQSVSLSVPSSKAAAGKLFGRLRSAEN